MERIERVGFDIVFSLVKRTGGPAVHQQLGNVMVPDRPARPFEKEQEILFICSTHLPQIGAI